MPIQHDASAHLSFPLDLLQIWALGSAAVPPAPPSAAAAPALVELTAGLLLDMEDRVTVLRRVERLTLVAI